METQDLVVNSDIARLLSLSDSAKASCSSCSSSKGPVDDCTLLNSMEAKLVRAISFDLHVSLSEYNLVLKAINAEGVKQRKQRKPVRRESQGRARAGSQVIVLPEWEGLESVASLFE